MSDYSPKEEVHDRRRRGPRERPKPPGTNVLVQMVYQARPALQEEGLPGEGVNRFGIKGKYIVDRMKHREYPILAWQAWPCKIGNGVVLLCLGWDSWVVAQVPKRAFYGYKLGDRQTFLRSARSGRGVR